MSSFNTISSPVFAKPLSHSTPNRNLEFDPSTTPPSPLVELKASTDRNSNLEQVNNNHYGFSDDYGGSKTLTLASSSSTQQNKGPDVRVSSPQDESPPRKLPPTNFRLSSAEQDNRLVPGLSFSREAGTSAAPVFFIGAGAEAAASRFPSTTAMKTSHQLDDPELNQTTFLKSPAIAPLFVGNEESFECFADGSQSFFDSTGDNNSLPCSRDATNDLSTAEASSSCLSVGVAGGGSSSSTSGVSSLPFTRNSQLRTSLRKSPQQQSNGETMGHRRWGSFRNTSGIKRPIAPVTSSSALATQLYRSSSFHSSGRSSAGDAEEMYSDGSLEDEVIDLTQKVHHLEEKFTVLAENQSDVDDRYARAKQENAELSTKLFMVDEQLRDAEQRGEQKLREEQRRSKEALTRLEREKQLQIENYEIRFQSLEKDLESLRAESGRYKQQLERERYDRVQLSDKLIEAERELSNVRDDNRKLLDEARADRDALTLESIGSQQALLDLKREFESLRKFQISKPTHLVPQRESIDGDLSEYHSRLIELEKEIKRLKSENKQLQEANDDLTAQVLSHGLEEGRHLLTLNHIGGGAENSLAAEFEAMSQDQMKTALKEQKEVNDQLKAYIDGILLNIVENYPQLLEVKNKGPRLDS